MATTLSPTAWRRWLALELRRLREAAGLNQKDVARALRCNVSKVSYIENAQRPVVPKDLNEVLLPLYNVPEDEWERYLTAARDARKERWWEQYTDEGALSAAGDLYVGLEQGAAEEFTYNPQAIPGLLQIPDYTKAILEHTAAWDADKSDAVLDLRIRRQEVLSRSRDPLKLWAVLDEAALRRQVGGRSTMRAQLEHLVEVAQFSNVHLQLLPFELGAHRAMLGGFVLLQFAWTQAADAGVVFLEHMYSLGQFIEERQHVVMYSDTFNQLRVDGVGQAETTLKLKAIAKEYT